MCALAPKLNMWDFKLISFLLSLRCWVELSPACTQGISGTHLSRRSGTTRWKSSNWRWGDRTSSWTAERYWPCCAPVCEMQVWAEKKTNKQKTDWSVLSWQAEVLCSVLITELKQFWSNKGNGRFWGDPVELSELTAHDGSGQESPWIGSWTSHPRLPFLFYVLAVNFCSLEAGSYYSWWISFLFILGIMFCCI